MFPTQEFIELFQITKPLPNCAYNEDVRSKDLSLCIAVDHNPDVLASGIFIINVLANLPSYRQHDGKCCFWVAQLSSGLFVLLECGYELNIAIDSWLKIQQSSFSLCELINELPQSDDFGRELKTLLQSQIKGKVEYGKAS